MDKWDVKHFRDFSVVPYGTFKRKQRNARIKKRVIKFSRRVYRGTMKIAKAYNGKKGRKGREIFERVYNNLMK
jgi:hypothetical protein